MRIYRRSGPERTSERHSRRPQQPHDRSGALAALAPWAPGSPGPGFPFLLIAYLGLRGGGYDEIVRGEVGIAVWWVVLVGAAVGVLPVGRISRGGFVAIGLLAAFGLWTALGIGWSESVEQSAAELGRVAALLGIFALAISMQGSDGLRRMVSGVGAGIALVGGRCAALAPSSVLVSAALRSRPDLDASITRLHYPLDYWNGLGAFIAIGIPLLLVAAAGARTLMHRGTLQRRHPSHRPRRASSPSPAGRPSRRSIALVVLFALHPRRRALVLPLP